MHIRRLINTIAQPAASLFLIASLTFLTACSSLQWSTAWSLRGLDPVELNPSVVRLMLNLPEGATSSNITLNMQLLYRDKATVIIDEDFELDLVSTGRDFGPASLSRQLQNPVVIQIPSTHVESVLQFQDLFRQEQIEPRGGSASFGLGLEWNQDWVKTYCETDGRPLILSAWILVDEVQGYLPLIEESPIAKMLDQQWQGICSKQ